MSGNRIILVIIAFILTISNAMAQKQHDYNSAWKKIDSLIEKGLPKSAITLLNYLYNQAKKEKQTTQQLKAVIIRSRLLGQIEEDSWKKNIAAVEKETTTAPPLVKQVLQSITADMYWQYFQEQRWKLYNRSATIQFNNKDIDTWGADAFHQKISALFQASLQPALALQQTNISQFDLIITKGNTRQLRPTLFDLLAQKALEYFENDETSITKPINAFELNDAAALAPASIFIRYKYTSRDSSSHLLQATKIYQSLIQFHQKDATPAAFIDVDLQRIVFANRNGSMPYKQQLYKEALAHIYAQYPTQSQAMQAGYLLAKYYETKGEQYQPNIGTLHDKMAFVEAIDISKKVSRAFPESEGGRNAANLLTTLQRPFLQVTVEKVNLIDQPMRILLEFKNTGTVYFKLVALPQNPTNATELETNNSAGWWIYHTQMSPIKAWSQVLPNAKDARKHSAEIKVDALPVGKYLLIASTHPSFTLESSTMCAAPLAVSNLAMVSNQMYTAIVHRNSGEPIANASLQVWFKKYDYNQRRQLIYEGETYTSNKNGIVQLSNIDNSNGQPLYLLSSHNDSLYIANEHNFYYSNYSDIENKEKQDESEITWARKHARYFIFTDRSLYRPGQTLFFKSIGISKNKATNLPQLYLPDTAQQVLLFDANSKQIAQLWLTPNNFGSISGSFSLPTTGLTGQFRIEIRGPSENSIQYINVEAYKRPKFFVTIESPNKSYRVNEPIALSGQAKAYAGNAIDNANVTYRVFRQARMLYPYMMATGRGIWPPMPSGSKMEITNGHTVTNIDGSFLIPFVAIPDATIDDALLPTFDYEVAATVTDLNGESHETTFTVSAGYRSLLLNVTLTKAMEQAADSTHQFSVSTTNLMGVQVAAAIQWKLYPLQAPTRLLRKRMWPAPDTSVMDRMTFEKYFPNDPFEGEDDYSTWKRLDVLKADTFHTSRQSLITIPAGSLPAGYYLLESNTTDKEGQSVSAISYLAIYDEKKGQLPAQSYLLETTANGNIQPGTKAVFFQGSSVSNVPVLQQILRSRTNENIAQDSLQWIRINGLASYSINTTEADRGGYTIARMMVQNNRLYSFNWQVQVPWNNKQLQLSFETFRNKLLPGQQELWKVKIAGPNSEKIAAEMLASMYDASLDQIFPHQWPTVMSWPNFISYNQWNGVSNFSSENGQLHQLYPKWLEIDKRYDQLFRVTENGNNLVSMRMVKAVPGMAKYEAMDASAAPVEESYDKVFTPIINGPASTVKKQTENTGEQGNITIRKNFNETAFFFPALHTDDSGHISFSFTMPEALTQWKLQLLAHTQSLQTVQQMQTVITQKELMVQPNAPRFFRQGDKLELVTKVVNLGTAEVTGVARLELLNAATMQPVDGWLQNIFPQQFFNAEPGQSVAVKFPIEIPVQYTEALVYRITATAGNNSDGEEMAIPVLSNRMLVTESFPLNMRGQKYQVFEWKKLLESAKSPTLQHQSFTINYTSNPVWLAIQALPYLMEYPYDCAEQTWNRFYANAMATKIVATMPKVKAALESWKNNDSALLLSPLMQNEALKQALLEETPWVLEAKNMNEQQQNLSLILNVMHMQTELEKSLSTLEKLQSSNGGFVWFKGGPDDRYMTQYIISGIGHLQKMKASPNELSNRIQQIANKGINYLDARMKEDYDRWKATKQTSIHAAVSPLQIQYLYMRSFFPDAKISPAHKEAHQYFLGLAAKDWVKNDKQQQGMIAMVLHRTGNVKLAKSIIASLQENSITSPEFGMYWKEYNNPGYYWWQAPVESHAMLMEAFAEIANNTSRINDLKTWLLKQKQTTNWPSTRATAEACYALLMTGSNWLEANPTVTINAGTWAVDNTKASAGSGYFSQMKTGNLVKPEMGKIVIDIDTHGDRNTTGMSSWGAAYWQYFEELDKITPSATPLSLQKKLMLQTISDAGIKLVPINNTTALKPGNKVIVRLEIRTDRQLEYVHLKDMRAACLEPVQATSGFKWQGGLGYYQAPSDASMNFFIQYLPKGTYVLEYPLIITHEGSFSNGISTIQCMYAPAFSSHTAGERLEIKNH